MPFDNRNQDLVYYVSGILLLILFICSSGNAWPDESSNYAQLRQRMIDEIKQDVITTADSLGTKELDPKVLEVVQATPRHEFVPPSLRLHAYDNQPLPIGHGKTISQPYVVAIMTHLLDLNKTDHVLEIGTGSGYQAAILSPLVDVVWTIEIVPELAESSKKLLDRLGYKNIQTRQGDGYYGWDSESSFDAILVTASVSHIPPPLVKQLKPGGKMLVPVGSPFLMQQLLLVEKDEDGTVKSKQLLPVTFIPLTGEH